jgi:eukaryotic-like serine/threonine-protein kinase
MSWSDVALDVAERLLLLRLDGREIEEELAGLDTETRKRVQGMIAGIDALSAAGALAPADATGTEAAKALIVSASDGAPRHVGRYRIERLIGRGGQGEVHLVWDEALQRRAALKVLHSNWIGPEASAEALRREARLAGGLDHRGICKVHDFGVFDGRAYIAMEFVGGGSLAERLKRRESGNLLFHRPRDVARFVAAVADALHFAPERGLIHRDVKPSNILVDRDGSPIVSDFGLARRVDAEQSFAHEAVGTAAYMAPEQFRLKGAELDRRVDVWALGVVLFECTAGRRPFEADSREHLMCSILGNDAPDPRRFVGGLSKDLSAVVAKALARERTHRYATALELAEDLRAFADGRPVSRDETAHCAACKYGCGATRSSPVPFRRRSRHWSGSSFRRKGASIASDSERRRRRQVASRLRRRTSK